VDLRRFRESVGERDWFRRHFPDLVRPLACLMPLYGRGLRRPGVFRIALALNDLLSWQRNRGVASARHLPPGRLVDTLETAKLFPQADRRGLQGGALWYDAVMLSPERIAIEMLRWACTWGATALNYTEATGLIVEQGAVRGIEARDGLADRALRFRADRVVNATGPWSRQIARQAGQDLPGLFRPALAFNLLLKRVPIAEVALAIEPPRPAAPTYFCLPWKGLLMAGTSYAAAAENSLEAAPSEAQVAAFLADLNAAVPGLTLAADDVQQVYAGLLPARSTGTIDLANREVIHNHGATGGPRGLFSVSGVKFTTARQVAEVALRTIFGRELRACLKAPERPQPLVDLTDQTLLGTATPLDGGSCEIEALLRRLVREEAVIHAEDLLLRRLDSTGVLADRAKASDMLRCALAPLAPDLTEFDGSSSLPIS
jgi:glycerol-3-phosphate dehydrogenase